MIAQAVLDRVLGRTTDKPTQDDLDVVCLEAAGIVSPPA